jgi:hypothetical protein
MTDAPDSVGKWIEHYVAIRDKLKQMEEDHTKKIAPLVDLQNKLTGLLQGFLDQSGSESVKTAHGTCYTSTRYSASLPDAGAFMKFVVDNQQFDMLDRRANATAVRAYVEANGALPPGVSLNALRTVGVRRKS